ncbi:winged helix-turn-helix domain-containing protein [Burkholderia anthina]|uniref:winged helix-turn-helix domain-containing protein n=1 Tax=Burkholderia anthina TaxID=179879 RepID=UPI000F5E409C|nr:winged helix-turn-helix domain-containing protein [Burkholderia anthina]RQX81815.1 winged helix-turn-helix domain-containing protein [Burkholderia anthina]
MITLRNLSNPNLVGRRICDLLASEGQLTQAALSLLIGVPRGTISKYLTALMDDGYIRIENSISYVRPKGVKGRRHFLIALYARTAKEFPKDERDRDELTAFDLHRIMNAVVARGKQN